MHVVDFHGKIEIHAYMVLPSDPCWGLLFVTFSRVVGDLHLGDQRVTWKKLVGKFQHFSPKNPKHQRTASWQFFVTFLGCLSNLFKD